MGSLAAVFRGAVQAQVIDGKRPTFMLLCMSCTCLSSCQQAYILQVTACATDKQLKGQMFPMIDAMDKVHQAFRQQGALGDGYVLPSCHFTQLIRYVRMLRVSVNLLTSSAYSAGKAVKQRDWDKLDGASDVGHMIDVRAIMPLLPVICSHDLRAQVNSLSEAEYQQIRKKNGYMSFQRLHLKG